MPGIVDRAGAGVAEQAFWKIETAITGALSRVKVRICLRKETIR